MLQADSEDMYTAWISALQQAIGRALQQSHGHADSPQSQSADTSTSDGKQRKPRLTIKINLTFNMVLFKSKI
jgi:hypothetical protein